MSSIGGQELLFGAVSTVVPRAPLALWDSCRVFEVSNCSSHSWSCSLDSWRCLIWSTAVSSLSSSALNTESIFSKRSFSDLIPWRRRAKQEWNMSDRRSQDRNGKLIDCYADYSLSAALLTQFTWIIYSQVWSLQLLVCLIRSINLPDMRYVFYKKENILSFSKGNMEITWVIFKFPSVE